MSRNQQSSWHHTCQHEDILSATPPRLELVPERAVDLEICAAETEDRTQDELLWYRRLYENMPSVYFTLDRTGIILSVNQFGAKRLGYRCEELIQKPIFSLFESSDHERLSEALMSLLKTVPSEISNWEFRLDCPASKVIWVKVVARVLPSVQENFSDSDSSAGPEILMICEDITERKSKDTLRQKEQGFHAMANTAPVMLWMSEENGLYSFFNQFWLEFTGRSIEQEQGWGWLEGVHPEDKISSQKKYNLALAGQAKFESEYRLKRSDGKYRWILNYGVPHFNSDDKFAGYIGCCIDITQHKLVEVALRESQQAAKAQLEEVESLNRLKDEFLSTVSHELRTPLTNMKMAIQMLGISLNQEQKLLLDSKASRYFQILSNECEREINLINNFLDLQRLDSSIKPLVLETIQVDEWLARVVELFKARNRSSLQNLSIKIDPNLPSLVCDPFSLERILVELLTNGCKFSPGDAEITVTAKLKSGNIQFRVMNSGVEIPAEELPRIFNKFYRIPSNDPWKQGGTGLGLALVQKLTASLGGTINVESKAKCTYFTIQLPVSGEPEVVG
jgi:PAS domain S-box-containing protein